MRYELTRRREAAIWELTAHWNKANRPGSPRSENLCEAWARRDRVMPVSGGFEPFHPDEEWQWLSNVRLRPALLSNGATGWAVTKTKPSGYELKVWELTTLEQDDAVLTLACEMGFLHKPEGWIDR